VKMRWMVGLGLVALGALLALGVLVVSMRPEAQRREISRINRVYAYRSWQSTAVYLALGERYSIRARGSWLYSPWAGPNGPGGQRRFRAPAYYPLPNVPGGALIGRIGQKGQPFYVGERMAGRADEHGVLYLRIDDDRLGDNQGWLAVEVVLNKSTPTPPYSVPRQ
jgi:hypothetical protein